MSTIYTHGLENKVRDLSDVLSTLIAIKPSFISKFTAIPPVTQTKHEWLNDVLKPLELSYTAYTQATGVFTVASSSGWNVGDIVRVKGDSAVFKITATTSTSITVEFVASNGSATDAIGDIATTAGTLVFDSHPVVENSTAGVDLFSQSGSEHNFTQIFRGEVNLSNTALAVRQYGNENQMNVQLERALTLVKNHINRSALFGVRAESATSADVRTAGGLYFYGTQTGCNKVDATVSSTANPLSIKIVNDAAQAVLNAGGEPNLILCGNGQARVISQILRSQISYTPQDGTRGNFVNRMMVESNGAIMEVMVDPALDAMDSDVWVMDSRGLGIGYLNGRALKSEPISTPGTDGTKEMLIGELTFEFKNAKQRLCRITGLKASASTLS